MRVSAQNPDRNASLWGIWFWLVFCFLLFALYSILQASVQISSIGLEEAVYRWQTGVGLIWLLLYISSIVAFGYCEPGLKAKSVEKDRRSKVNSAVSSSVELFGCLSVNLFSLS